MEKGKIIDFVKEIFPHPENENMIGERTYSVHLFYSLIILGVVFDNIAQAGISFVLKLHKLNFFIGIGIREE